jgi:deoxyribose-phosphate aldolase
MIKDLSKYIDFTYLNEDCSYEIIKQLCQTAINHGYFAVCCPDIFVMYAKTLLEKTNIKVVTVISFPKGNDTLEHKLSQTYFALESGADEIDMVMNYNLLLKGKTIELKNEISAVTDLVHKNGKILKIIIESGLLDFDKVKIACDICAAAYVDFVKTSTGKVTVGAEIDKVKYMRSILPANIFIKASGGIKTKQQILDFIDAGAVRIGTSAIV